MGKRNLAFKLPAAERAWLDRQLIERGFQDYEVLAAQLTARGNPMSKSALHRYGQWLERQLLARPGEPVRRSIDERVALAQARHGQGAIVIVIEPASLETYTLCADLTYTKVRDAISALALAGQQDGEPA